MIRPSLVTEVRNFVGLASYYHRFVMNFASISTHLPRLTQKEVPFVWLDQCKESFQMVKTLLTTTPILSLPFENKDFIFFCDASHLGLSHDLNWDPGHPKLTKASDEPLALPYEHNKNKKL